MGQQSSKSSHVEAAKKLFNGEERTKIEGLFREIAPGELHSFPEKNLVQQLREYFPVSFISRLFHEMANIEQESEAATAKSSKRVSTGAFLVALALILKGTSDQQSNIIRRLASSDGRVSSTASEMLLFSQEIIKAFFSNVAWTDAVKTWKLGTPSASDTGINKLANYLLRDLFYKDGKRPENKYMLPVEEYDDRALAKWLSANILFQSMFNYVFHKVFPVTVIEKPTAIPSCYDKNFKQGTMLTYSSICLINNSLPAGLRKAWTALYDSREHGESTSTLMKCIKGQGPSVVIVEDEDKHIFGCFVDESWEFNSAFKGSHTCFLFTLEPEFGIYQTSGKNENYAYCNMHNETLPNGLGVGGQMNYFGFWLDSEFGHGKSHQCTTFDSPQLSKKQEFRVARVEVWGVGPERSSKAEELDQYGNVHRKASILDSDPTANALLEMAGKPQKSEGLRQISQTERVPEEEETEES